MGEHTIMSFEQYGKKVTFEIPYSDTNLSEMFQAIVGCLVTLSWSEESILLGMRDYANDNLPDEEEC